MKINTKRTVRNIELEKRKILFQFTLMAVGSLICALCFSRLLSDGAIIRSTEKIVQHFRGERTVSMTFSEFGKILLRSCVAEMFCIIITFVFSFSYINYLVSDLILIFAGFRFGLSAAMVKLATLRAVGIGNSLAFWLIGALELAILLYYSYKVGVYSINMRKFSSESARTVINRKALAPTVLLTLTSLSATLALGALYCLILYVF